MKNLLFLMILSAGTCGLASAQPAPSAVDKAKDTTTHQSQKKLFINPGVLYISNLTYAGRKNVVSTPVLTPYVNLILKKGFFLSATGYVNTAKNEWGIDGAGITPGYVFRLNRHFDGYISATKYFLADSSSLILASMKGSIDGGIDFTPKLVDVGLSFDYLLGKSRDFLAGVSLSRDIKATVFGKASLKITPTASFMAGTQSFYETYYINTITKKRTSSGGSSQSQNTLGGLLGGGQSTPDTSKIITSVITQKQQKEIRKFYPLNTGFSIPVSLHAGKFLFTLTPNLVFPFNEVDLGGSSSLQLNKPFFFYSAGMSVIL